MLATFDQVLQLVVTNPRAVAQAILPHNDIVQQIRQQVEPANLPLNFAVPDFCQCGRCRELPEMFAVIFICLLHNVLNI